MKTRPALQVGTKLIEVLGGQQTTQQLDIQPIDQTQINLMEVIDMDVLALN